MTGATPDVKIVEVGPRDGLQNEKVVVPTAIKLELIARLVQAGVSDIEATAFVSPRWVPQMADHADVMRGLQCDGDTRFSVLTPNLKGFESALACGAREVAVFASASETFSQRNINCSISESMERFEPVVQAARDAGVKVRGYVSCVVGCPYEGAIAPSNVALVAMNLYELGCHEISLGDTIGVGSPEQIIPMLEAVSDHVPVDSLAGHYHNSRGMALKNIEVSYRFGLRTFDASVSGLGGCPYAPGAKGNVATEDVVDLFHGMGVHTGIDLAALVDCSRWISGVLAREPGSALAAKASPNGVESVSRA
jgi:hydroxymethylglutaryl-CoA lyase